MEKRRLDKLGIETSLLGFGCMRFPTNAEGKIDEALVETLLDKAMASGINYYDAAYFYGGGECERVLGKLMKKYDRDSFYFVTKLPSWNCETLEDVDRIFRDQLDKLQADYIDFYLLHALDKERWEHVLKLGILERLEQYRAEGKIRYLGFSFHDSYEVFEEILNYRDWDFCQIQLNYMDANIQAGLKGYALTEEKQVPLVIMEPVKGGSLANYAQDIMDKFHAVTPGASAASFALRWVGSLPNVKVILSGMTTPEMIEDNVNTFTDFKPLSAKEQETVKEVVDLLNSRVQNGCTGCGYCMPCPAGVNIPSCFRIWNNYHMYQNYNNVKRSWEHFLGEDKKPKNCIKCGKCEAACPQKISIRADLERVQADLDKKEMCF